MQPQLSIPTFGDERLPPRFWAKVRIGSIPAHRPGLGPCWQWTASRDRDGYGRFLVGKNLHAHRLAYETLVGPIPDGLESDHLCRNRPCVCPAHIEPVTHAVNKQRGVCAPQNGEANPRAKLTEEQVQEIRRLRGVLSQRQVAEDFGVSWHQISHIQRGENWKE